MLQLSDSRVTPHGVKGLLADAPHRAAGSNAPLLLDDPGVAWRVVRGALDVFVVPMHDGALAGAREFLYEVHAGDFLFGSSLGPGATHALLAVGGTDATVAPVALDALEAAADAGSDRDTVTIAFERHVRLVSAALADGDAPRIDEPLAPDQEERRLAPELVVGAHRDVVWVHVTAGALRVFGDEDYALEGGAPPFPLASGLWLLSEGDLGLGASVRTLSTETLMASGMLREAFTAYQARVSTLVERWLHRAARARAAQLASRLAEDDTTRRESFRALASILSVLPTDETRRTTAPLMAAMELVGAAQGITFRAPSGPIPSRDPHGRARAIAQGSAVGQRRVRLTPEWWTRDVGPMLGFLEMRAMMSVPGEEGDGVELVPVALLPVGRSGYQLVNPEAGIRSDVTPEISRHLSGFAVQFYRGLPARALKPIDLWRFAVFGARRDARTLVAIGAASALLGLLLPLLTAYLFDEVIPGADRSAVMTVFIALVVASLASAAFEFTRSIAVLRLHTRMGGALQMAVIDRLLRLPATFFRGYAPGDLGQRAMGITAIGDQLGGATIGTVLASVTSVSALVLLFTYSVPLTFLTLGILAVNVTVSFLIARAALRHQREYQEASGTLAGLVLQLLDGIAKLRVSASEARAFARWADAFRRQQEVAFRLGSFSINVGVFHAAIGVMSSMALYWVYAGMRGENGDGLTTGQFLAFSAASGSLLAAGTALAGLALSLLDLIPLWERARPVLDALPESNMYRPDPGVLNGRIEIDNVKFSYGTDGPAVLHGVSFDVQPGQFVALVGPSGSGKSTLLRILLGFEKPGSGAIRFDGHDVAMIDVASLRRQIGVVLQHSALTAGDIFTNIVGASSLTMDDAWDAARRAGLEDDLRAMPMGMHTVVSEGGGALSGGQRQRILIARALVARPRILFFDEATSALDNRTQRIVSEAVDALRVTRIVVAHRLSTIRNADRILVMDAGRIVESGTFDELMTQGGLFASMARRQEA